MKRFLLMLFLSLLIGCKGSNTIDNSLISSFDGISSGIEEKGFYKIPQNSSVSTQGNLPFLDVGSMQFYKPTRKPSSIIGISHGNSYILETIIESDPTVDLAKLNSIKILFTEFKNEVEELIDLKSKIRYLESELFKAKGNTTLQSTLQNDFITINQKITKKRTTIRKKYLDISKAINTNGLMVIQWNSNTEKKTKAKLSDFMGVNAAKQQGYSGVVLISGLRTAVLYVGEDFKENWESKLAFKSILDNRIELTTYVMQTKYIVSLSEYDLSNYVNARFDIAYEDLKNPEKLKLDKLEMEAFLSKVSSLYNTGIFKGAKRKTIDINWENKVGKSNVDEVDGWHTFFAVNSDPEDIIDLFNEK